MDTVVIDPADDARGMFRKVIGRHTYGVSVLTTVVGSLDYAMTANTLTSVSLEPLLVLICVEQQARFHDAVLEAEFFGATVLGTHQRASSDWFATPGRPLVGQFDQTPFTRGPVFGAPLLDGGLSALEARVVATHPAGDHTVVIGEVVAMALPDEVGPALVHYRGRYGTLS